MDDRIKQYIKNGKQFLIKNDLDGFYENLYVNEVAENDVSVITRFLEQNGINTMKYLKKIPYGYAYEMNLSDLSSSNPVEDYVLSFPSHIKFIEGYAFSGAEGFNTVDLRGIDFIRRGAFDNSEVQEIFLDGKWKQIDRLAFTDCNVRMVFLPDDDQFDLNKENLLKYISWDTKPWFEVY